MWTTVVLHRATDDVDQQPVARLCGADRAGSRPTRIARGGVVTITGQNFGDCLDPGTLPPASGHWAAR